MKLTSKFNIDLSKLFDDKQENQEDKEDQDDGENVYFYQEVQ